MRFADTIGNSDIPSHVARLGAPVMRVADTIGNGDIPSHGGSRLGAPIMRFAAASGGAAGAVNAVMRMTSDSRVEYLAKHSLMESLSDVQTIVSYSKMLEDTSADYQSEFDSFNANAVHLAKYAASLLKDDAIYTEAGISTLRDADEAAVSNAYFAVRIIEAAIEHEFTQAEDLNNIDPDSELGKDVRNIVTSSLQVAEAAHSQMNVMNPLGKGATEGYFSADRAVSVPWEHMVSGIKEYGAVSAKASGMAELQSLSNDALLLLTRPLRTGLNPSETDMNLAVLALAIKQHETKEHFTMSIDLPEAGVEEELSGSPYAVISRLIQLSESENIDFDMKEQVRNLLIADEQLALLSVAIVGGHSKEPALGASINVEHLTPRAGFERDINAARR